MRVTKVLEHEQPPREIRAVDSGNRDFPFPEMLSDEMVGVVFINAPHGFPGGHEEDMAGPGSPYAVKSPVGAVPKEGFHSQRVKAAECETQSLMDVSQYLSDFRHLFVGRRKRRPG